MEDLKLKDFAALKITLASPEEVLSWSHGEILKPETINYRTFRAEKDGLFCERIFGPTKDFECYCGKYKRVRYRGVICDKCGVEVTYSRVRRERMGHIKLVTPVAHVWFFRGIPSKMGLLLDMSPRSLEAVIYFSAFIVTAVNGDKKASCLSALEEELTKKKKEPAAETDKQILEVEKQAEKEIKSLTMADLAKRGFVGEEMRLKSRQEIASLRDQLVVKQDKLAKEYQRTEKFVDGIKELTILTDSEYLKYGEWVDKFCKLSIGAEAIGSILAKVDLEGLASDLRHRLEEAAGQRRIRLSKRLAVVEGLRRAKIRPEWMIMNILPVIPPDLRPMVQLEGGRFATSDLNDLYRRVLNRNNRLKKLMDLGAPEIIVRNEKRMLQEAVDALIDSSRRRKTMRLARGKQELRSLSDLLKGKQGRFRQNLLGKRVDYSGRSVIVVGPELALDECGLPKEMALELFKPFVLREILLRGLAPNVKSARYFLDLRSPEVWDILEEISKHHPVMLNRAPTLHRLGIVAFYPKLIEGSAIQLHPCVCAGFNADFDGDQMAVHLPLSSKSIKEVSDFMLSTKNLLKPSDGSPIVQPVRDMLLGSYYLTSIDPKLPMPETVFKDFAEAQLALSTGKIALRQKIQLWWQGEVLETTPGRITLNEILPDQLRFYNKVLEKKEMRNLVVQTLKDFGPEVTVKLIDNLKNLGFKYETLSGFSLSLLDCVTPKEKPQVLATADEEAAKVDANFKRGLITKQEAMRLTQAVWTEATQKLDDLSWQLLDDQNPIKMIVYSGGARASREQVKQISGMRGLIADPLGRIVNLPIKSNYHEGLTGFEYFASSRGSRKGLTDKALKTADAGYLTRRLVDVAQDVVVREEDCGTEAGRFLHASDATALTDFATMVYGRTAAEDLKIGRKVVVKRNELIGLAAAAQIAEAKIEKVFVRSPLTCQTRFGICAACYGMDLGSREVVKIGTPVGIVAAQSIGEPGTQLTLRTFHTGGVLGKDITQGLPRVEEVFEARTPKNLSVMTEIAGKVELEEREGKRFVRVVNTDPAGEVPFVEYEVDPVSEIMVAPGSLVAAGEPLTEGYLDLTELLQAVGLEETERYIINEIQRVYSTQGVSLNDKHLEVIVRQMFSKVRVESPGDTTFLAAEIVSRSQLEEANEGIIAAGGEPATAEVILLGITRSSLATDSFLAAASFMETTRVLTEAAATGKVDRLLGLKENVIIGRLIPVGERARLK